MEYINFEILLAIENVEWWYLEGLKKEEKKKNIFRIKSLFYCNGQADNEKSNEGRKGTGRRSSSAALR